MTDAPAVPAAGRSPHTPARRRRRRLVTVAALVLVVATGGYIAVCASAPLPALRPALLVPGSASIDADATLADAAIATEILPTAFGWAGDDAVWASDPAPHPLASITKLVTVLVCQEAAPVAPGEAGPSYTWTEADVERQAELVALDGVAFPVPAGTVFSAHDMLTLMLLPSANDFASAYANSVFGSNEAFVAAAKEWASENGIESLTIVEPSGMEEGNQASAADVVRIGRLVLADPTLAELTRLPAADVPGIGTVENTNPLLGAAGVIGLKTGRSSDAGYNLAAAQTGDVSGRAVVKISVTLGRPTAQDRADSSRRVLASMNSMAQPREFVAEGEKLGSVVTWTGKAVPLLAAQAASGTLVPGEAASREISLGQLEAGPAGQAAGSVAVESPAGAADVPVVTGASITEPDLWWRLTHPNALLGWG